MSDDWVTKLGKKQLFGEKEGRRSVNSPMRHGEQRRATIPRRAVSGERLGLDKRSSAPGRRLSDAPVRQTARDLRVAGTAASESATAAGRGIIVSAPVERRVAAKAAGTIGSSTSILKKAGRLGKIAAAGVAAYGAYKAWKGE